MKHRKLITVLSSMCIILQGVIAAQVRININLATLTLNLSDNEKIIKQYPIAAGKPYTQTITGNYSIIQKQINPSWTDPATGKYVSPGPWNPLGVRWMRVIKNYGIHGNASPSSIGTYASHGCMRMYNSDVIEIFNRVNLGTPVSISYDTIERYPSAIVVHPDTYGRGRANYNTLLHEASKKGIKLSSQKQKAIKSNINKKDIVFSTNWSLFINKDFVTSDVPLVNRVKMTTSTETKIVTTRTEETVEGSVYKQVKIISTPVTTTTKKKQIFQERSINIDYIAKYLSLKYTTIPKNQISINGSLLDYTVVKNIKYISVDALSKILGVDSQSKDYGLQIIRFNFPYAKYNSTYIQADTKILNYKPYISITELSKALGLQKNVKIYKSGVFFNGKKLEGNWLNKSFYASSDSIGRALKKSPDYWSIKKYVNFI